MYKNILIFFQQYLIIKRPLETIRNNSLTIKSFLKRSKIVINGHSNKIVIKKGNYKYLKIGIDGNYNTITIEEETYLRNLEIIIHGNNHQIHIGKRTEMGRTSFVCCGEKSKIFIGNDCLLASNINLKTCDGHTIYQEGKAINTSKDIIINDSIWIAQDVNILKGVTIGSNSVVGINTLLTAGTFSSNVILGGIPAKIIKKNITWSKECTV